MTYVKKLTNIDAKCIVKSSVFRLTVNVVVSTYFLLQVLEEECGWCFDCDGEFLVIGTTKGRILLWCLKTGTRSVNSCLNLFKAHLFQKFKFACIQAL